jgi:hypothetical protein
VLRLDAAFSSQRKTPSHGFSFATQDSRSNPNRSSAKAKAVASQPHSKKNNFSQREHFDPPITPYLLAIV